MHKWRVQVLRWVPGFLRVGNAGNQSSHLTFWSRMRPQHIAEGVSPRKGSPRKPSREAREAAAALRLAVTKFALNNHTLSAHPSLPPLRGSAHLGRPILRACAAQLPAYAASRPKRFSPVQPHETPDQSRVTVGLPASTWSERQKSATSKSVSEGYESAEK